MIVDIEVLSSDPGNELVAMTITRYGWKYAALWSRCKCRKRGKCAVTGVDYPAGADVFRPMGNGTHRSARVVASVVLEEMKKV